MEYLVMPMERLWPGMTGTVKTQKLATLPQIANGTQQAVVLVDDQLEMGGVIAFIVHWNCKPATTDPATSTTDASTTTTAPTPTTVPTPLGCLQNGNWY